MSKSIYVYYGSVYKTLNEVKRAAPFKGDKFEEYKLVNSFVVTTPEFAYSVGSTSKTPKKAKTSKKSKPSKKAKAS